MIALAATDCTTLTGVGKVLCQTNQILNSIIPVLVALGVVYFVWNIVQYVIADAEEAKKKGRDGMIYGIIGLAVIIGLWGLVNVVIGTFGLSGDRPALPVAESADACVLADSGVTFQVLSSFVVCNIYRGVVPLIFALALVMFVWGVVQFVIKSDDEGKKEKGRQFMLWGVIALAVMFSVWGLVRILTSTFGLENPFIPQVQPATKS